MHVWQRCSIVYCIQELVQARHGCGGTARVSLNVRPQREWLLTEGLRIRWRRTGALLSCSSSRYPESYRICKIRPPRPLCEYQAADFQHKSCNRCSQQALARHPTWLLTTGSLLVAALLLRAAASGWLKRRRGGSPVAWRRWVGMHNGGEFARLHAPLRRILAGCTMPSTPFSSGKALLQRSGREQRKHYTTTTADSSASENSPQWRQFTLIHPHPFCKWDMVSIETRSKNV